MNTARLKESFARVAMRGDEVALFCCSDLLVRHPGTGQMFPVSMAPPRGRLLPGLGRIAADVEHTERPAAFGLVARVMTEAAAAVPGGQIHGEDFGWSEPCT